MLNHPSSFSLALITAGGFCELHQWQDAWDTLEDLPPEDRAHPEVFALRLRIFVGMERWESAAILAESMVAKGDRSPETWLQGALSIRHARSADEARVFLEQGKKHLSEIALYHYLLARYACATGDMAACKEHLARAFALDKDLRFRALDDEELAPFW